MKNKTFLIVDDNAFDRELLTRVFMKRFGVKTFEADSAAKCYEILDRESVDLVLMDILMPDVNGTDALKKIREKTNPIDLPIIMVTSKSEDAEVIHCLQSGANDYIVKPFNFDVAITRITTHLRLAELSREMARLREHAALEAMIATYNHEINNPLAIAISCAEDEGLSKNPANQEKLLASLWRIAGIVKKIREVTEESEIEMQDYSSKTKMIKVR